MFFRRSSKTQEIEPPLRRGLIFLEAKIGGNKFSWVCIEVEELKQQNQHSLIKVRNVTGIFDEYKDQTAQIVPKWMATNQITWL